MSASETRRIALSASARSLEPEAALGEALPEIGRQLAAAGAGPHHLATMAWEAGEPAAFHPSRRAIDLAYREVFGGFRPPVTLAAASPGAPLTIRAEALVPPPRAGAAWGGFAAPDLAREYSPRGQVPDMGALFRGWSRTGQAFRERTAGRAALDLAYGPTPAETLDLYHPAHRLGSPPPVWAFIHGGYWQASTKEQHAAYAAGMLDAGFAVALIEYGLLPQVGLPAIIGQIRAALGFLAREAASLGVDGGRLHLAGHSAGGHLAAMAAIDPDGPQIASALLLSGLFDLDPLMQLPIGGLLGLSSEAAVTAASPLRHRPLPGIAFGVAVGEGESGEFKRQSKAIAATWGAPDTLVLQGANHFTLLDGLVQGELLDLGAGHRPVTDGVVIRRAGPADVAAIVGLIDEAQDPGGPGLSQRMPAELVQGFLAAMPCIVALRDGNLAGVLLAQPKPEGDAAGPVTRAMLDAYPGDAASYVYGPVVVRAEERGRGLAAAMAAQLRRALPGREGILFIAADNGPSLRAHAKIGASPVADFVWQDRPFRVLSLRSRPRRQRVAFIGWGAINARVGTLLAARATAVDIVGVAIRGEPGPGRDLPAGAAHLRSPAELGSLKPDLVVEAAGHGAVESWGPAALEASRAFAVASTSAFCDEALLARLVEAAERHGSQILVPPGAIGGIDALAAAAALGLDQVVHTIVKPPAAWRGTAAESLLDLAGLRERRSFFRGSAREAAARFPQNANATATTALAGIGLDRTEVELVADPTATRNGHRISARGAFGQMQIALDNSPLAANPKSSELTALSLVRLIENRSRALVV